MPGTGYKVIGGGSGNAVIAGHNCCLMSFDLGVSQAVEDDSSYCDAANVASNHGSGTLNWSASARGKLVYDATNSSPNLTAITGDPVTCTWTIFTGCTYTGAWVISSANISHRKNAPWIPITFTLAGSGVIVEAWDETA